MKFSDIEPKNLGLSKSDISRLKPDIEHLEKIVKEFQQDLTTENKGNLKFIKFVIKLIKNNDIEIPILPEVANKILALSNNENSSFSDYADIVKNDPSTALKVIKLANSPLYRGLRDVSDIGLAMSRIGVNGIKEIVLTDSLSSMFFKNKIFKKHIDKIWKTSVLTALLASQIANFFKINPSLMYTISLVHKIGSILIFDIVERFNKTTDFEHYLSDDFALRVGNAFNKRLTVNILENWYFTQKQILSVKNYDIKPIPVAPLEHKILYLSQIVINALDVIRMDYDADSVFPYVFMLNESSLDLKPEALKKMTKTAYNHYNDYIKDLYN